MRAISLLLCLPIASFSLNSSALFAASVEPLSHEERTQLAHAVCRGTVESVVSYRSRDNLVHTKATIRITEVFKGRTPSRVTLHYRGGHLEEAGETVTGMPELKPGEDRLFFLARHQAGHFSTVAGPDGAPIVSDSEPRHLNSAAEPGVLQRMRSLYPSPAEGIDLGKFEAEDNNDFLQDHSHAVPLSGDPMGLFLPPRRSIIPDRGEPIHYLVDADALPQGISEAEAIQAVENALAAWSEVSSATFQFEGIESFGEAASVYGSEENMDDGRLRIQLHDSYDVVASGVLGIGGHVYTWEPGFDDGGSGATIDGVGFHRVTRGYVVINHTATSLQNLNTFEATLCHEIGHALGLAHSSEVQNESDPYLREAIMFYQIHGDDRGATLAQWDKDVIETVHPAETPPPFGFDRYMRIVTSHTPLQNPEVNEITLRGHSLYADELTAELLHPTSTNGEFTRSGDVLAFTADGAFWDSDGFHPEDNEFHERVFVRFDDGRHQSAPAQVRVIQFLLDSHANGLPDSWAEEHFGSASPTPGFSGPHDDPDGDGLTNLQEFLLGTHPLGNSRFRVSEFDQEFLRFEAQPYHVYELFESADLETWQPTGRVVQPTSSTGEFHLPSNGASRLFHRVHWLR